MTLHVGLDRPIKLEWMDVLANKLRTERDWKVLRQYMHDFLAPERPNYESRRKNLTVLFRIWISLPEEQLEMRERAIELLSKEEMTDHLYIHWGMTLMTYPFFKDIACIVGKLLSLQGDVSLPQIQRRIAELWGQRSTASIAARKIVRMMANWGALAESTIQNNYVSTNPLSVSNEGALWLMEALLQAEQSKSMLLNTLQSAPTAFPFKIDIAHSQLIQSNKLEIVRQGLNTDVIRLR